LGPYQDFFLAERPGLAGRFLRKTKPHSGFNGPDGALFAAGALAFKGVAAFGKPTSTTEARRHGAKQKGVVSGDPRQSPTARRGRRDRLGVETQQLADCS